MVLSSSLSSSAGAEARRDRSPTDTEPLSDDIDLAPRLWAGADESSRFIAAADMGVAGRGEYDAWEMGCDGELAVRVKTEDAVE